MLESVSARVAHFRRNRRGGAAGWVALVVVLFLAFLAWRAGWFAPFGFPP